MDERLLRQQIPFVLKGSHFQGLGKQYIGKVRDNYTQGNRRILITSDRLSAFDRVIAHIPFKGQVLNAMTKFWFKETESICPNYVKDYPDPNVIVGEECTPLKIEMIVRGYITGSTSTSLWVNYSKGERNMCGNALPEGLRKNQRLPEPILTPTTKADYGDHDKNISPAEIVSEGILTKDEWEQLAQYSLLLYTKGVEIAARQGVILVDTKYEFGKNTEGKIVLIDEIHTPDSSRFWIADTYEERLKNEQEPDNINKEYLRLWLTDKGYMGEGELPEIPEEVIIETARRYIEAFERITGERFEGVPGDSLPRIEANLKPYFSSL